MSIVEHGISIGISRVNVFFFMKIKIKGTLAHEDYERMIPMLRSSVEGVKEPDVRVLIDVTEFDGWELRAAWDDFKFGMEFRQLFSKIAIVGTCAVEKYAVKIGSWFMSGDMRFFKSLDDAYEWLNQEEAAQTTAVQKDLRARKEEIRDELESLFKSNLKIVDWNVPEPDDQDASEILVNILEEKLQEIKSDVKDGKYK
ncbi:STAS/SEC14 domain-containing protein [Sulfurimonas sp.]|uniref:STAS/SEC14 domain-containing protein n=1 Tax=Sulfurimonas sp. TaxID=2022749 RepID=UPI003562A599